VDFKSAILMMKPAEVIRDAFRTASTCSLARRDFWHIAMSATWLEMATPDIIQILPGGT
jgi:hypothetical protein